MGSCDSIPLPPLPLKLVVATQSAFFEGLQIFGPFSLQSQPKILVSSDANEKIQREY